MAEPSASASPGSVTSNTFALPLKPGASFPPIPAGGFKADERLVGTVAGKAIPGAGARLTAGFAPSNNPAVYAHSVTTTHSNIYRIPIL